jgi:hypothetical protein
MLKLTLALRDSLVTNIPALVSEVNSTEVDKDGNPYVALDLPKPAEGATSTFSLGVRTDMLKRDLVELPARACGIYLRTPTLEGEQGYSEVIFPFTIDIYLGSENADDMYIQALKWGLVLDLWQERYGGRVLPGFTTEEAPDLDISYSLELRGSEYRQLVTRTGVFTTHE